MTPQEDILTGIVDGLYEGARDGFMTRADFGRLVLKFADMLAKAAMRQRLAEAEQCQALLTANNLASC